MKSGPVPQRVYVTCSGVHSQVIFCSRRRWKSKTINLESKARCSQVKRTSSGHVIASDKRNMYLTQVPKAKQLPSDVAVTVITHESFRRCQTRMLVDSRSMPCNDVCADREPRHKFHRTRHDGCLSIGFHRRHGFQQTKQLAASSLISRRWVQARQGAVTDALDHMRKLAAALFQFTLGRLTSQKLASASIGWLHRTAE